RMFVETEGIATLDIGLSSWVVIVLDFADDLTGIIDPDGSADARKRAISETRGVERAKGVRISEHAVPDSVPVSLCTDHLPVVVDAGQESRGRARKIDGGEMVSGRTRDGFGKSCVKDFAVKLLDHAKAAELALRPIPVAVMITVFGRELTLGKLIDGFD